MSNGDQSPDIPEYALQSMRYILEYISGRASGREVISSMYAYALASGTKPSSKWAGFDDAVEWLNEIETIMDAARTTGDPEFFNKAVAAGELAWVSDLPRGRKKIMPPMSARKMAASHAFCEHSTVLYALTCLRDYIECGLQLDVQKSYVEGPVMLCGMVEDYERGLRNAYGLSEEDDTALEQGASRIKAKMLEAMREIDLIKKDVGEEALWRAPLESWHEVFCGMKAGEEDPLEGRDDRISAIRRIVSSCWVPSYIANSTFFAGFGNGIPESVFDKAAEQAIQDACRAVMYSFFSADYSAIKQRQRDDRAAIVKTVPLAAEQPAPPKAEFNKHVVKRYIKNMTNQELLEIAFSAVLFSIIEVSARENAIREAEDFQARIHASTGAVREYYEKELADARQELEQSRREVEAMARRDREDAARADLLQKRADGLEDELKAMRHEARQLLKLVEELQERLNKAESTEEEPEETAETLPEKEQDISWVYDKTFLFLCSHETLAKKLLERFPESSLLDDPSTMNALTADSVEGVVCITKEVPHTAYYKAKNQCYKLGIPLYHANTVNVDRIAAEVAEQMLAAQTGEQKD